MASLLAATGGGPGLSSLLSGDAGYEITCIHETPPWLSGLRAPWLFWLQAWVLLSGLRAWVLLSGLRAWATSLLLSGLQLQAPRLSELRTHGYQG
jgi:hypothetical protein